MDAARSMPACMSGGGRTMAVPCSALRTLHRLLPSPDPSKPPAALCVQQWVCVSPTILACCAAPPPPAPLDPLQPEPHAASPAGGTVRRGAGQQRSTAGGRPAAAGGWVHGWGCCEWAGRIGRCRAAPRDVRTCPPVGPRAAPPRALLPAVAMGPLWYAGCTHPYPVLCGTPALRYATTRMQTTCVRGLQATLEAQAADMAGRLAALQVRAHPSGCCKCVVSILRGVTCVVRCCASRARGVQRRLLHWPMGHGRGCVEGSSGSDPI